MAVGYNVIEDNQPVRDAFARHGITGWHRGLPEGFHLVIGENGSGKTRFLAAAREIMEADNQLFIHLDFAGDVPVEPSEDNDLSLYVLENRFLPQEKCADLLRYARLHTLEFLLTLEDTLRTPRLAKGLSRPYLSVRDLLAKVTGKTLEQDSHTKRLMMTDRQGRSLPVADAVAEMSPGEQSLFFSATALLALSSQGIPYRLLMDEPEKHLHPHALLELMRIIREELKPQAVYCATHSVFLLPGCSFSEVIFIKESRVEQPSSKMFGNIFASLVGGEEKSESIYHFLSAVRDWEYAGFLSECFLRPESVAETRKDDPQFQKFLRQLQALLIKKNTAVHILDFGAGSGRIPLSIEAEMSEKEKKLLTGGQIKFFVYDQHEIHEKMPGWVTVIRTRQELANRKKEFDLILLFNVLHEVDIFDWYKDLNLINSVLSPAGKILFSERRVLSKGEFPYGKSGYLVLGEAGLRQLFGLDSVEEALLENNHRDPTSGYLIRPDRPRVRKKHILAALDDLMDASWREIRKFMNQPENKRQYGRLYAFYSQQYVNARHAYELLEGSSREQTPAFQENARTAKQEEEDKAFVAVMDEFDRLKKQEQNTAKTQETTVVNSSIDDLLKNIKEKGRQGKPIAYTVEQSPAGKAFEQPHTYHTLEDILDSDLEPVEKKQQIQRLAQNLDRPGRECKRWLEENYPGEYGERNDPDPAMV